MNTVQQTLRICITITLGSLLLACQSDSNDRALGTLERHRILINAPASLTITTLAVAEGDRVEIGDVLLTLDDRSAKANLALAQAQLERAVAQLDKAINGSRKEELSIAAAQVDEANANLTEKSQQLERINTLYKRNISDKAQLDVAQSGFNSAKAKLTQAKQHLNLMRNGSRPEDIAIAEATKAAAQAQVELMQHHLEELTLLAPSAAEVDLISARVGSRASPAATLLSLLSDAPAYARVYLPESQLANLSTGTEVEVHIDGMATLQPGIVRNIRATPAFTPYYALNEDDRSRLMYLAEISLPELPVETVTGIQLEVKLP